ncbi:hypothetical protein [Streptacidiphilus sp. EB129]|jgi:hypothetical protein|uniref:hypothetical protein n=1 Tax=Streptacidiphilus sp. EB129 TaxID=3156262 RepID=UPI003511BA3D
MEQGAAASRVPIDLPLGTAVQTVTGEGSLDGVHGSVPGMPLVPPSPQTNDPQALLPDPLVPPLSSAHGSPDLHVLGPAPGGDGSVRPGGLAVSLPEAPVRAVGAAASLGKPLTLPGGVGSTQGPQLDLAHLDPKLSAPRLESAPTGSVTVDQSGAKGHVGHTVKDFLDTAAGMAQELRG